MVRLGGSVVVVLRFDLNVFCVGVASWFCGFGFSCGVGCYSFVCLTGQVCGVLLSVVCLPYILSGVFCFGWCIWKWLFVVT